jgi:protein ImuA
MHVVQVSDMTSFYRSIPDPMGTRARVSALRRVIGAMGEPAGVAGEGAEVLPIGLAGIDNVLGGGLASGVLHEIAAAREAEIAAATGFALTLAARRTKRAVLWIAEDMAMAESGAPYGPGLDDLGLAPERLITVVAAKARDLLWVMEEALICRGVGAVIGEIRSPARGVDLTATRRLSLAASRREGFAFLLRTMPGTEASAAATRWTVGCAPSVAAAALPGTGPPRLKLDLVRNRRGPLGSWIVEFNRVERSFDLAPAHRESVAEAAFDRSHCAAVA